jgi:hypothetical protein
MFQYYTEENKEVPVVAPWFCMQQNYSAAKKTCYFLKSKKSIAFSCMIEKHIFNIYKIVASDKHTDVLGLNAKRYHT